jgi:hypothetical protein
MNTIRFAAGTVLLSAFAAGISAHEPVAPAARGYPGFSPHRPSGVVHRAGRRGDFEYVPYGSFVGEGVPLYPRVRVKDCDDIAPGAVPVVIAIRDPNICRKACRCCPPACVFVQVYAPSCPPRKVDVSDHGNEIDLDYGDYEIEIKSRGGVVTVDYDD